MSSTFSILKTGGTTKVVKCLIINLPVLFLLRFILIKIILEIVKSEH